MPEFIHDGKNVPLAPLISDGDTVDFVFDWTDLLDLENGETINVSNWSTAGLTLGGTGVNGPKTSAIIGDATVGDTYLVSNSIRTNLNRELKRSMKVRCWAL